MNPNDKPTDLVAQLGEIAPISQGVGTVATSWINIAEFHCVLAEIRTGVLGGSATVAAKIQQATSSGGAGAKDVTGKSITAISTSGQSALINLRTQELDVNGGFTFVQLQITVATAASLVAAAVMGFGPRYQPASLLNDATVVQVV